MKDKKISRNFWIGLTTVIALFLFYFGFNFLKGRNVFESTEEYFVPLSDTGGLSRSSSVLINGYTVGKVKDLKFDYENMYSSVAILAVSRDLNLPLGTTAYVKTNPFGGAAMILEVPEVNTGDYYFTPGDTIPSRIRPDLMKEIEEEIAPQVSRSLASLDSLIATVKSVVSDPNITSTISEISLSAANIRNTSAQLNAYMSKKMPTILNNIDSTSIAVKQISNSVPADELESAVLEFKAVVANLRKVSDQVNGKDSSVGLLLNDPELYRQLQSTVSSADSLITDIKNHPKRYLKISIF